MDKLDEIKKYLKNKKINYIEIPDESINKIYQLYINNNKEEIETCIENYYYDTFYYINKNYNKMKKYYFTAINMQSNMQSNMHSNNDYVIYNIWLNLGVYYEKIEKDYDLMKNNQRLYLMAIENNKKINKCLFSIFIYKILKISLKFYY